mmetsp:Transcript_27957/g.56120  ORF Transcript_27957/g.56120 Transcript_27957/m.56120 type:complete len:284 (-) Transcript_27957:2-853(-)
MVLCAHDVWWQFFLALCIFKDVTMTSKSCSRRNRVIQRRYRRRGRRSPNTPGDPPDPGGRKKKPARTFNFNTFPHHGAPPTSYLQYIKSILVPKFIIRREHYLSLRNSLSIDRHTHYKPMGFRCSLIPLPPTPNDSTPTSINALSDYHASSIMNNLETDELPILPPSSLPRDPTIQLHSPMNLCYSPSSLPLHPVTSIGPILTLCALCQIFGLTHLFHRQNRPRHPSKPRSSILRRVSSSTPFFQLLSLSSHQPTLCPHPITSDINSPISRPLLQVSDDANSA